MKLDRTTYEAWLLDRIEGNLTVAQEQELNAFLAANPDLAADLGELPSVEEDGAGFPWKEELKKRYPPSGRPDVARVDDFLIARLEGELDAERSKDLERLLFEHPELQRNAKLIAATKSEAAAISLEDKSSIVRHFPPQGMPDLHRLNDFLVARLEGDLTLQQRVALDTLLASDPLAMEQWVLMQATRVPAERVVFEGKDQLKKKTGRVIFMGVRWQRLAAAASIALIIGLGWLALREEAPGPGIAETVEPGAGPSPVKEREQGEVPEVEKAPSENGAASDQAPLQTQGEEDPLTDPRAPKSDQLVPPQREEAPAIAQVRSRPIDRASQERVPTAALVTQGLPPAPLEDELVAAANTGHHQTVGELFTTTVRREVLGNDEVNEKPLNGNDVVAAVDKGLGAVSGDRAGIEVERSQKRSRFRLRLGDLALSASTGR